MRRHRRGAHPWRRARGNRSARGHGRRAERRGPESRPLDRATCRPRRLARVQSVFPHSRCRLAVGQINLPTSHIRRRPGLPFDTGRAALAMSAFLNGTYRLGFDIQASESPHAQAQRVSPAAERACVAHSASTRSSPLCSLLSAAPVHSLPGIRRRRKPLAIHSGGALGSRMRAQQMIISPRAASANYKWR